MPIILSDNQLQINYNAGSTPNAGVRVFALGTAVPGTNANTAVLKFTHNGTAGSGVSLRWYFGAGRQSGTFAENWWQSRIGIFVSTTTTWTETYTQNWYSEGNGIINTSFLISGTILQLNVTQSDTGAWVESYVEAYSSMWDRITIGY